jgi:iron complex outermembrane receptor protein
MKRTYYSVIFISVLFETAVLNAQYPARKSSVNIKDSTSVLSRTQQIDTVRITAPKGGDILMKEPYTEPFSLSPVISKVNVRQIQKQGAINLIDALEYIPGGLTETRGRQVKQFFSVRGQKYPYPDYALNGVWQQEFEELPYFISASDIEEIEIVRSSAALLTGLSGIEGLINIRTREYNQPEVSAEMEYGSYNSLHSHISGGGRMGRFAFAAGGGYDRTDGPAGKHSKEAMGTLYSRLSWERSEKLKVLGSIYFLDGKRELTIAEPPADQKYINMVQNFDPFWSILSNAKVILRPRENLSTEFQIFYSYRDPKFNDEVTRISTNEKDIEWGMNLMQSVSFARSNTLRIGGLYDHWLAPNGKRFYTGKKCNTETFSAVLVDEQRIGYFTVDAGLRLTKRYLVDYAAFNIEGEGGAFKNVTPIHDEWESPVIQGSFGVSRNWPGLFSVNFNSAVGQVRPREGTLDVNLNVPENETRVKLDLGAVKQLGKTGKVTLSTFAVIQKNAIALSGTTFTDPETNLVRELYLNRDQNQLGAEFEIVSPRVLDLFGAYFNISAMKSEMRENGMMVRSRENPIVIASTGILLDKKNFDFNIYLKYVSAFESIRFAPANAGPQPLGDFLAIDFNGGYTFQGKMPLRLYIRVRNLTDKRYSTVVGYPDFGRMLYLGMRLNFIKIPDPDTK